MSQFFEALTRTGQTAQPDLKMFVMVSPAFLHCLHSISCLSSLKHEKINLWSGPWLSPSVAGQCREGEGEFQHINEWRVEGHLAVNGACLEDHKGQMTMPCSVPAIKFINDKRRKDQICTLQYYPLFYPIWKRCKRRQNLDKTSLLLLELPSRC